MLTAELAALLASPAIELAADSAAEAALETAEAPLERAEEAAWLMDALWLLLAYFARAER